MRIRDKSAKDNLILELRKLFLSGDMTKEDFENICSLKFKIASKKKQSDEKRKKWQQRKLKIIR